MGWKIIAATILRLARGFVDSGMKIQETKYTAQKNARPLREQRSTGFYGPLCVTFPAGCDGRKPSIALITKPFNSSQTIPVEIRSIHFPRVRWGLDFLSLILVDKGSIHWLPGRL
jgi:hypothetical protein